MSRDEQLSELKENKEKLATVEEKLEKAEESTKAIKTEKKKLASTIRKEELNDLLDAIEKTNLSVTDDIEFKKKNK